jgi:hypothetical protein
VLIDGALAPGKPVKNNGGMSLMRENEHVKQLSAARIRLIADRRHAAKEIADENRRGLNDNSCDALILIQTTIEAIDRAVADEAKLAREDSKGVFIKASDPPA